MAKLKDYIPEVIHAVRQAGGMSQTDLTEAVWGTSGRGNTSLTTALFPSMVSLGLMTMEKQGRAKVFRATAKGIRTMEHMCQERGYGPCNASDAIVA